MGGSGVGITTLQASKQRRLFPRLENNPAPFPRHSSSHIRSALTNSQNPTKNTSHAAVIEGGTTIELGPGSLQTTHPPQRNGRPASPWPAPIPTPRGILGATPVVEPHSALESLPGEAPCRSLAPPSPPPPSLRALPSCLPERASLRRLPLSRPAACCVLLRFRRPDCRRRASRYGTCAPPAPRAPPANGGGVVIADCCISWSPRSRCWRARGSVRAGLAGANCRARGSRVFVDAWWWRA